MSVLTLNAQRLADGLELAEPLVGRDEIGRLDTVFHNMARSLIQRNRENETFVYSVSHDLRSPLVNLMGFSQELEVDCARLRETLAANDPATKIGDTPRRILETDIPESIHYIRSAVTRVSAIIDALLRLSRSGRVEYHFRMVELDDVVVRIVESLRSSIQERDVRVVIGKDLAAVWGDPVAVEQVFANLIANAVNYLDPSRPGIVEIGRAKERETSQAAPLLVYYVKDNGLGISETGQTKLFLPFQRFHAETTRGEGIGLALTRRIIQRHGGKIWAESSIDAGSTFFVSFPAEPPSKSKASSKESILGEA